MTCWPAPSPAATRNANSRIPRHKLLLPRHSSASLVLNTIGAGEVANLSGPGPVLAESVQIADA